MDIVEKDSTGSPILIHFNTCNENHKQVVILALNELTFQNITFSQHRYRPLPARPLKTSETVEEVNSHETTGEKDQE